MQFWALPLCMHNNGGQEVGLFLSTERKNKKRRERGTNTQHCWRDQSQWQGHAQACWLQIQKARKHKKQKNEKIQKKTNDKRRDQRLFPATPTPGFLGDDGMCWLTSSHAIHEVKGHSAGWTNEKAKAWPARRDQQVKHSVMRWKKKERGGATEAPWKGWVGQKQLRKKKETEWKAGPKRRNWEGGGISVK